MTWRSIIGCDPCVYCGGRADTCDHIRPAVDGGTWDWWNIAPACRACNGAKGSMPLLLFLAGMRVHGWKAGRKTKAERARRRAVRIEKRRRRRAIPPPMMTSFRELVSLKVG